LGRRFGVNAIAAYAGSELMQIILPAVGWQDPIYRRVFSGPITPVAGAFISSLAYALACVSIWYLVVYVMDRRGVYLKL